ncbi:hypothetical protein [Urbifossiella limnaea]|uniref:hypothetical protein n=1 Tax=Urbifossiella limnaea TaxID=2528023 RepID=UPI00192E6BF3|nr:hypothetical protein [Urbifossiella limnaea]
MVYLAGDGVRADPKAAQVLAERAAELDDPSGLILMGEMHFRAGELDCKRRPRSAAPVGGRAADREV